MVLEEAAGYIYGLMLSYGYVGAFISAFLSHLVPFIALPYLAVVWLLVTTVPQLNPALIGLLSGLGAGMGKVSSYYIGVGGARVVGEARRRELEALRGLLKDYAALAAFLAAATPIPDDVVLITVGMIKYPLWKFLVSTVLGKILLCSAVALTASKFTEILGWLVGAEGGLTGTFISVATMLVFTFFVLKINWSFIAEVVGREGWRGLVAKVRREGLGTIFLSRKSRKSRA
ncbi:MAG: hypothetical protein DRN06_08505 [Thermoprotei archaeon]|nr:MAG: hypothetical protein DRN06_08505 [Thermoprotei archaeon]